MNKRIERMLKDMRDFSERTGLKNAVVGISGGKDSTIVAKLAMEALGKDNVLGVTMPKDREDLCEFQYQVANTLGINLIKVPIDNAFYSILSDAQRPLFEKGLVGHDPDMRMAGINLQPRLRMSTLYYVGRLMNAFVLNTSNFDERIVGYSTIWGDDVGDYGPLQYLHVSQVKQLGYDLGIPKEFVDIPPSDGLSGKTDEEALGFTYAEVEDLLNKFNEEYRDTDPKCEVGFVEEDHWPEEVRLKSTGEIKKLEGHELAIVRMHNKNLFKFNSIFISCYSHYLEIIEEKKEKK